MAAGSGRPWLIQGGMGVAVSGWRLAAAVARAGQLGVVSGTGIDNVFVRRLQDEGVSPGLRAVLERFPVPALVDATVARYARRPPGAPYRTAPPITHRRQGRAQDLTVLAAYAEVALAKAGHDGPVGVNLLTKIELPMLPTLYGAMLAGVDYVLMGAGLPTHVPGSLDRFARREPVSLASRTADGDVLPDLHFDPARFGDGPALRRPAFLAIVSSHVVANALSRRSNGTVDGFVVERSVAGGHNAPPRGPLHVDDLGDPVYGPRDAIDHGALRALGVPFWLAGGITSPDDVAAALELGAAGVQVGSLFAYCRESGMMPSLRRGVLAEVGDHPVAVRTSTRASSTGYPFKVAAIPGTLSDPEVYRQRRRVCDLGYLREAYRTPNGGVGYRCPAEPVERYVAKGGDPADTEGRVCLCNGLMAACGLGQVRAGGDVETPIVTSGDALNDVAVLARAGEYGALDVIAHLASGAGGAGVR